MKDTKRPGVVLCVPPDADEAIALGTSLAKFIEEPATASPAVEGHSVTAACLLAEAVFVCLLPDAVSRSLPARKERQDLLLIDAEGKIVDAVPLDKEVVGSPVDLVAALAQLLHGKDGKRLVERSDAGRAALPAGDANAIDAALAKLASDKAEERDAAEADLHRLAANATAVLVHAQRDSKDPEVVERIEQVFTSLFIDAQQTERGNLPFGAAWPQAARVDPCPACGMAISDDDAKRFLRFLSEEGK